MHCIVWRRVLGVVSKLIRPHCTVTWQSSWKVEMIKDGHAIRRHWPPNQTSWVAAIAVLWTLFLPCPVSWRLVQGCCFGERAVRFEEPWPTSFKMALSWDWLAHRDFSLELIGYTTPPAHPWLIPHVWVWACFFQATAEGEVWFWESSSLLQAIGSKPRNHCSNHGSVLQPTL